jgi:4-hydroxybenzoate polyprenyltransferase
VNDRRLLDALVFSSLWVAAAAGALSVACALAMGIAPTAAATGLAFAGTLVVYNVDRLRDLDRDRATAPQRSAFVVRHGGDLALLAFGAALASVGFGLAAGPRAWALLAPVLLAGLLHRRLKHLTFAKSGYITAAWVAVVVGVPAAIDPRATAVGWAIAFTTTAIFANAIACNIRDHEVAAARFGPRRALRAARTIAAAGALLGLVTPMPVASLAAVPLAMFAVLIPFRPSERYGLMAVDGALLFGAIAAAALAHQF